jgi:hypothetical protein
LAPHHRRPQGIDFVDTGAGITRWRAAAIVCRNPKLAEIAAEFRRKILRCFPGPEEMCMSPETFRSRAVECMLLAQNASDFHHRSLLLSMAETWSVLAQSAEAMERYVEIRDGPKPH